MATASDGHDPEQNSDGEIACEPFAAQVAAIVLRWQASIPPAAPSAAGERWMSRSHHGESKSASA